MHRSRPYQAAFTLIEIAFAILIFAGAFVILLGLHASAMQRAYLDERRQEAMLLARQVLAALEARSEPLQPTESRGPVREIISEASGVAGDLLESDPDPGNRYEAVLRVENLGIPDVDDEAMRRVQVTVSWGESALENVTVFYFIPNDPGDGTVEANDEEEG